MAIEIRKGTPEDIENFIGLLQEVCNCMVCKEWLYLDPPEDVRAMMADGSMKLWVAMDGSRMVAAFDILLPGFASYNYGYDLEFTKDELLRTINMDTVVVHPVYRGLGLQKRLMQEAEKSIILEGKRILLCTVHPDNSFSLNNFLAQGYIIERKLNKYGSVRYILRKDVP